MVTDLLKPLDRDAYTIGIVCALPKELLAVRLMFDRRHRDLDLDKLDSNHYALGSIFTHNIVAACLPSGDYGTCSAAGVASHLRRSFPKVEFCLLVGIGGGVPSPQNDIRLGDIIVSQPTENHSGTIKYDFEKVMQNGTFQQIGSHQRPPQQLLTAISSLLSDPDLGTEPLRPYLEVIAARKPEYAYPGHKLDKLFAAECSHQNPDLSCDDICNDSTIARIARSTDQPNILYGLIASGDKVMKDAQTRDHISKKCKALCFEMEAAGVVNIVQCLVIRGICDYSDSHKNKIWQEYACATAAAYAKLLLRYVRSTKLSYCSRCYASCTVFVIAVGAVPCHSRPSRAGSYQY